MPTVALDLPLGPIPVTPSVERWQAMSPAERERFIVSVNEALSDAANLMSEGRPHKRAKSRALDMLGLHFRAMGRRIYLAEELSVLYPGASAFVPDVMAVLDVEEPEDDQRMAWVVADEGMKGLDWVLEVLWAGNRKKDLEDNVVLYASLGIPEYFVYDQRQQRIVAYRLPPGGKKYQPVLAQGGLYRSEVLGVDLAIVDRSLRFFQGAAELYDTAHLIHRLESMLASLQERAEQSAREAERSAREAERSAREAEQAMSAAERSRKLVRTAVVTLLSSRGVTCSPEALSRLSTCEDADTLQRWLERALVATSEEGVFGPT